MKEKAKRAKKSRKRRLIDWKWGIPLLIGLIGLVVQLAITPIIGLPESENNVAGKLWMSGQDIPPLNLIYTLSHEGKLQSEYSPSFSYTLQIEQRLLFLNPMVWAPPKTYYAPHEDCKLIRITQSEHLGYRQVNDEAVILWPTTKSFDKKMSSIQLVWELSDCSADKVRLQSQRHEKGLRVQVSNDYDYPVQYLGMVKLPLIKTNRLYAIDDSPPTLFAPKSLEIRTESSAERQFEVDFPFIIELPEHMLVTFDIQILEQPPKISLVVAPTVPPAPVPMPVNWWLIGGIIVTAIIVAAVVALTRMRRRS